MKKNKITKVKTTKEIMKSLKNCTTGYDADYILKKAGEEMEKMKGENMYGEDSFYYKAMTLLEPEKGVLLISAVPKRYEVFVVDFNLKLQKEYNCITPSEKSLAEVVALNFVRVLETQHKINSYLGKETIADIGVGYLNVLSRELDRAQRHYLTSLQMLKILKNPPLEVNIRTQTAVVGKNQIVQTNNKNDKTI